MNREGRINSYRDLLVWQKGMALAKEVYSMTRRFPDDERFGLIAQMRRAAVSIPSNIAEGQARQGRKEFVQFLSHAELDAQVTLAVGLGYCQSSHVHQSVATISELQKMLASLRQKSAVRLAASH